MMEANVVVPGNAAPAPFLVCDPGPTLADH
jgi:hypothetical protein